MKDPVQPLRWEDGVLWILDQRKLPGKVEWICARNVETVARAIESLAVRGAPIIGIAAAYGVAIAARSPRANAERISAAISRLARTRPTGFNLFYALREMEAELAKGERGISQRLEKKAIAIHREDARACRKIAEFGCSLFEERENVLTYCNTGALATGGVGTALGVIKLGFHRKKIREVFACETRPVGQGARLTVWECSQNKIPVTLICDNMVAALMASGKVQRVFVGADRIARNGDASNKIGTFQVAVIAARFGIPFHVVAPTTTFDPALRTGADIPIEQRDAREVTRWIPGFETDSHVRVWNPAFDVTPAKLIHSFVTETGILHPPFKEGVFTR